MDELELGLVAAFIGGLVPGLPLCLFGGSIRGRGGLAVGDLGTGLMADQLPGLRPTRSSQYGSAAVKQSTRSPRPDAVDA